MQFTELMNANKAKDMSSEQRELERTAVVNRVVSTIRKHIAQGYEGCRITLNNRQFNLTCDFFHSYLENELGYKIHIGLGGVEIFWG